MSLFTAKKTTARTYHTTAARKTSVTAKVTAAQSYQTTASLQVDT